MTGSEALARIHATYSDAELLEARDEPDSGIVERFTGRAALAVLFGDDPQGTNAMRRRVRRAFETSGHGMSAGEALASARRLFRQDSLREV